ncbi:hypothetical protein VTJ04DRAFT_2068 [Mycothermus thermophilus]|uniref:uncharacterized protein n=1 Tax=Humicola insolens TaxID=85995 RepID=UPI003743790F
MAPSVAKTAAVQSNQPVTSLLAARQTAGPWVAQTLHRPPSAGPRTSWRQVATDGGPQIKERTPLSPTIAHDASEHTRLIPTRCDTSSRHDFLALVFLVSFFPFFITSPREGFRLKDTPQRVHIDRSPPPFDFVAVDPIVPSFISHS